MTPSADWPLPRAAYVHVPFCRHRCGYCNFTVVAGRDDLIEAYLDALELELRSLGEPRPVDTLFLGGGTPTHLPEPALARLLQLVRHWFVLPPTATGQPKSKIAQHGGEFSIEANPIDLVQHKADLLVSAGISRLSLGVQSLFTEKLRFLERDHTPEQALSALAVARQTFPSVSLDLIFGCPDDEELRWSQEIETALAACPDHISTYGLTYERGTTFWGRLQRGNWSRCDEERERTCYLRAIDRLTAAGLEHYEVSNFARPGHRCRHNEVYWAAASYYAAGPGASRYVDGVRQTNHRSTSTYIRRMLSGQSPVAEQEQLAPEARAREALVLGLRRMSGVQSDHFAEQTGFQVSHLMGVWLNRYLEWGLMEWHTPWLRLTRQGLLVSDSLWPRILQGV